ncbi:hypothetical protein cypCar_00019312 [Cyprinus carpio]|nr:hypothetical protein cypCar_00019312 [Cyprinus carpio]
MQVLSKDQKRPKACCEDTVAQRGNGFTRQSGASEQVYRLMLYCFSVYNGSWDSNGYRAKTLAELNTEELCQWFSNIGLQKCLPFIRVASSYSLTSLHHQKKAKRKSSTLTQLVSLQSPVMLVPTQVKADPDGHYGFSAH